MTTIDTRANLLKLATYLASLPADYKHFEMNDFLIQPDFSKVGHYARHNGGVETCGTAACAVGHGPSAGVYIPQRFIREHSDGGEYVLWSAYAYDQFIGDEDTGHIFNFLFSSEWSFIDNTPHGAASRIRYYLAHGLPDEFAEDEYFQPSDDDIILP